MTFSPLFPEIQFFLREKVFMSIKLFLSCSLFFKKKPLHVIILFLR